MSDQGPPKKKPGTGQPTRRLGETKGLGADQQDRNLQGIAPAVVDAFLNAGSKKNQPPAPDLEAGSGLFTAPLEPGASLSLPRSGDSLGAFKVGSDNDDVKSKFKRIKAMAEAARLEAAALPPPPPPDEEPPPPEKPGGTRPLGTASLDPMRQALLDGRKKPGTGALENADIKLQHLAMRAKQQKGGPSGTKKLDKLERSVAGALGEKGALKLRQSLKALEDKALPGKLSALADQVNKLLPEGSEHYARLGAEVGKQVIMNNLNPVLAVSMAVKESADRLEKLKDWDKLSNRERVANMALLTSNMAEILGAVTPPPVNFGVQVMGAGLLLVGMASEHSEVVEDLAKAAGGGKVAEAGNQIASRVKNAWEELNDRLSAKKRPKLPRQVQSVLESEGWKKLKQHPTGQRIADGTENVLYNLARRQEAFSASWDARLDKLLKRKKKKK
ncbi:MAG: hypothetical protein JWM80_6385 [Cyanobacteria bacterium RYN_339]|nr:hypothetical protein [Cyanobacteria bacterium RYN_339]